MHNTMRFKKEYRYFLWRDAIVPPFIAPYRTVVTRPLDVEKMKKAAALFVGKHDFAAFAATRGKGLDPKDTTRHVYSCSLSSRGQEMVAAHSGRWISL